MPLSERPRERLARSGPESLSVQELLAVVLGRGVRGESVLRTAQKLIEHFHGPQGIAGASFEELIGIDGIGPAKAAQILAALELGKRLRYYPAGDKEPPVQRPEDVVKLVQKHLEGKQQEIFMAIYLDSRNRPVNVSPLFVGGLNSSQVDPRVAFKGAVSAKAASIIFVHNHPSGDCQPSDDDIDVSRRLVKAGEILGIEVLDHIIVAGKDHLSLKARKLL
ncbi:MAG: DNA repair protein RadC [Chloroflexi bacterium]|nr:DNA repair protein RadC [Chloroflexota bacterium]